MNDDVKRRIAFWAAVALTAAAGGLTAWFLVNDADLWGALVYGGDAREMGDLPGVLSGPYQAAAARTWGVCST